MDIQITYNLDSDVSFQTQFLKIHYELLEKRYFSAALDNLLAAFPRITDDCYNRALNSLLYHVVAALGASGRPLSERTYEKLLKLPMYRNLSDGTRFMQHTHQQWLKEKELDIIRKQKKLQFDGTL